MTEILGDVQNLVVVRCWCGLDHAIPDTLRNEQLRCRREGLEDHYVYCPLGHKYAPSGEGKAAKLERNLAQERASHDQTRAELRDTEARRRAEKAAKTRIKNRVGNGVCPCCNRSFANLTRHMKGQHPEYAEKAQPGA